MDKVQKIDGIIQDIHNGDIESALEYLVRLHNHMLADASSNIQKVDKIREAIYSNDINTALAYLVDLKYNLLEYTIRDSQ